MAFDEYAHFHGYLWEANTRDKIVAQLKSMGIVIGFSGARISPKGKKKSLKFKPIFT